MAVMGVCMFVGWRSRVRWATVAPYVFSLFMLSICLVMPYSQKHYLVFLFPGIVLAALRARTLTGGARRRLVIWLVVFHVLYWPGLWLKDYPVYFLSIATLAALMIYLAFASDGTATYIDPLPAPGTPPQEAERKDAGSGLPQDKHASPAESAVQRGSLPVPPVPLA